MKFQFYEDAAHGWYKTARSGVDALGVKISQYSYLDDAGFIYLEEDCDMPAVVRALNSAGVRFDVMPGSIYHETSPVRDLRRVQS